MNEIICHLIFIERVLAGNEHRDLAVVSYMANVGYSQMVDPREFLEALR
jgi:hypothetical protein